MGTRAILFDLDGTLIDSIELILSSYHHTMLKHRGSIPPDEIWLSGLGTPLRRQLQKFTDDPAELDAMAETYRLHNLEHHDRLVRAYPGTVDAVRQLKERGALLAVVTSKLREGALRGLHRCGFDGLFETLVCADEVQRPKPHPEPVIKAVTLLGVEPSQATFVGDSRHDLVAGKAAGVTTAAALWGPFDRPALATGAPDLWLQTPAQLPALLD